MSLLNNNMKFVRRRRSSYLNRGLDVYMGRKFTKMARLGVFVLTLLPLGISQSAGVTKVQEVETAGLYLSLMKDLPKSSVLLNSPYPQAIMVYGGARGKIEDESLIKGGHALQIRTGKPKKEAHQRGANTKTVADIKQGDTLCLIYWARNIGSPEKNETASLAAAGVQKSSAPYTTIMSQGHPLSYDWAPYVNKVESQDSIAAGEAEVFFHLGHKKQRIEIGPVYLFNLGKNIPLDFQSNACGKL